MPTTTHGAEPLTQKEILHCIEQGRRDHRAGHTRSRNPYGHFQKQQAWDLGWKQEDDKKRKQVRL